MNPASELARILVENKHAHASDIVGSAEEEIAAVEKKFSVKLPEAYRNFLRVMGNEGGLFESDSMWNLECLSDSLRLAKQSLASMRESEDEAVRNSATAFQLKKSFFVFEASDYFFYYFDTEAGDDPPVYSVKEDESIPFYTFPSFTAWLEVMTKDYSEFQGSLRS